MPLDSVLTNPFFVGIAGPLLLIIGIAIPKKLVRQADGWIADDFFQGLELCWGALGATVLNYYDIASQPDGRTQALLGNTSFLVVALITMFYVVSRHRDWGEKPPSRRRIVWLAIVCNLLGGVLFVAYVLFVKGIS